MINYSVLVTLCSLRKYCCFVIKPLDAKGKNCEDHYLLGYYYLDPSRVFVIFSLPCTFFPVHMRGKLRRSCISTLAFLPSLSLLACRTLDTRLSLRTYVEGQEVLGAQPFPDCPGLLQPRHIHHGQVPQEIPACLASQEYHLSLVFRHDTVKETVMETKI